ncbi:hypothetical protein R1flu_006474 [Riccia fluitans]|uniref:Ubiquinol oxidase n=1 Tax=Riccia fluitans TaxID=41844 RepID=A0ABD1YWG8_9MARC
MASGLGTTSVSCACHPSRLSNSRGLIQTPRSAVSGIYGKLAAGRKPVRFCSQFYGSREFVVSLRINSVPTGPSGFGKLRRGKMTRSALAEEPVLNREEVPEGWDKWAIAAERSFNTFATEATVKILESLYAKRLYARFYVLETIARVPYFAFVSVLHMYESFGWWRRADYLKIHFAESWNELHHLLVMEALGGDERWIDRFLAQHIAVAYYFLTVLMYLVSPRMAYNFSECVEKHAFSTYDKFIESHGEELKLLPAPEVAVQYYTKGDLYMFDEFQTDIEPNSRRPTIENLYDVFVNIREDEAQHCKTMQACQSGNSLRSPHKDAPLTEIANNETIPPPADCEGIFECATTSTSFADRARKQ